MSPRTPAFAAALALTAAPHAADVIEVGADDFRISDMEVGTSVTLGTSTAVAYNPDRNEYLVVWSGREGGLTGTEIYGQRIDAATGKEVGINDFRISDMGADGAPLYYLIAARRPDVVYNPIAREYLVVWYGDDQGGDHFQIYGQRLDEKGMEVGPNDFPLSSMGPGIVSPGYSAFDPSVAFNPDANEYLVVWGGTDGDFPAVPIEAEVFGQRLDGSTGAEIGADDFRISEMGPPGNSSYGAGDPYVVYNPARQEYLVVFRAEDDAGALAEGEFELYGQRLSGAAAAEVGPDDFRITDVGSDGDTKYAAWGPAVAWNSAADTYLVAWSGDEDLGAVVDYEFEVYGQLLAGDGAEIGANDFRISFSGPDGDTAYGASIPAVTYHAARDEFIVVWSGSDDEEGLASSQSEVYVQRLTGGAAALGNAQRISGSSLGPDPSLDAGSASVVYNPSSGELLVPWNVSSYPDNDPEEIYAQRLLVCDGAAPPASETVRPGSPPNPLAFLPGATGGPVLGGTWSPSVDHATFVPGAIADYLVVTALPANVPTPFGTLLCDLNAAPLQFPPVPPGVPLTLPIPASCTLAGATFSAQVGSFDGAQLALTNALDLVVGTE